MRFPAVLLPLADRDFRLLWMGRTMSSLGNHVSSVALPFQMLALGASPLQLGLAVGIQTAASVGLLLLGGAAADRLPRRAVILATDLAGAGVLGSVMVLAALGALRIEHLYVAALVLGAAGAFLSPAYTALIADLLPVERLRAGNAVGALGRSIARIAGPTIGGLTVALYGPAAAFGLDAFTFAFSFATLLVAHPARHVVPVAASIARDIGRGLGFVFATPWLWTTLLYFLLVNIAYAGQLGVMVPLLVRDTLGGGAATFGLLSAAYGVGTVVSGLLVAGLVTARPGRWLYGFEILAALGTFAIGLLPTTPAVVVGMVVTGAALSSSTVLWQSLLQRQVPPAMLGRVSSIDLFGNSLIIPVAPIVAAALVTSIGAPLTFIVAGVYGLALALIALVGSPVRGLREPIVAR